MESSIHLQVSKDTSAFLTLSENPFFTLGPILAAKWIIF